MRRVPCRRLMDRLRSTVKSSRRHSAIFGSPVAKDKRKNEIRGVGMMVTAGARQMPVTVADR